MAAGKFASDTTVPVEKTRAEIEKVLAKYGAEHFAYGTEPGLAVIGFRIPDAFSGILLAVRMHLPLPRKDEERFTRGWQGAKWKRAPDHADPEPERLGMYTRAALSYGVIPPRPPIPIRMTAPIDEIEPCRRAGYLRRFSVECKRLNLSRRNKVILRRALLRVEVCAI